MEIGFQKMHSVEFVLFMQRVSDNREEKAKEAEDDMPAIPSLSARKRCIITLAKSIIALYYLSSLPLGMPDVWLLWKVILILGQERAGCHSKILTLLLIEMGLSRDAPENSSNFNNTSTYRRLQEETRSHCF
ncbi:unnamed protein product [Cuscuta epithymum]|uniref:Uncharacterized protein n=1 Tax=Cuscuta epithymum TaxID=186058 RepID=A0AAV0F110_9ASTE|nr:unnamed protein product [Cuscuta epithymum]CAH9129170.1 unnamed protein product [Cuscuta epithymum]